jgi:hypothetical protein
MEFQRKTLAFGRLAVLNKFKARGGIHGELEKL